MTNEARTEAAIAYIITREGGYVNSPADRGGPTKWGITLDTLREYTHTPALKESDVQNLTMETAKEIYRVRYINNLGLNLIEDDTLFLLAVDSAVLNGRRRTVTWLQRACGVVEDGIFGPVTRKTLNTGDYYWAFFALRLKHFGSLISRNSSQAIFAAGWLNRVAFFCDRQKVREVFVERP